MEHHLKRVIGLCMVLTLLPTAMSVFSRLLGPPMRNLLTALTPATPTTALSPLVTAFVIVIFIVGVAVRISRAAHQRDPAWRIRDTLEQRGRTLPSYPAEDLPVQNQSRPRPDSDPPLPF